MTNTHEEPQREAREQTDVPVSEVDEQEAAGIVDDVALEPSDVTLPGDPSFDETHEPLTGADADPPPGAQAG